jgi:hypothetical protein
MLDGEKQKDIVALVKNLSRITGDFFAFIANNKSLMEKFEELNSGFETHKRALQSLSDEIEGEGKFWDDENIEIYRKASGEITFFPKALYKNNPNGETAGE